MTSLQIKQRIEDIIETQLVDYGLTRSTLSYANFERQTSEDRHLSFIVSIASTSTDPGIKQGAYSKAETRIQIRLLTVIDPADETTAADISAEYSAEIAKVVCHKYSDVNYNFVCYHVDTEYQYQSNYIVSSINVVAHHFINLTLD